MGSVAVHPHHHHMMRMCFAIERCAIDHQVNDRHTAHGKNSTCHFGFKWWLQDQTHQRFSVKVFAQGKTPLPLLFWTLGGIFLCLDFTISFYRETIADTFVFQYHFPLIGGRGLRAPPVDR